MSFRQISACVGRDDRSSRFRRHWNPAGGPINMPSSSKHMLQIGFGYEPKSLLVREAKTHQEISFLQAGRSSARLKNRC